MTRSVFIALIGFAVTILAGVLFLAQRSGEGVEAQESPPPAVEATAPAAPRQPSFDVVRIGEQGDTVIAGRALPRAEVAVLDGGREIGRVIADERGEWVLVPQLPMEAGARQLTLKAFNPDGSETQSSDPVILVVPQRAGDPAIALKPEGAAGARLLQGPAALAEAGALSIDMVDHGEGGGLLIAGRAEPGARIHLYLDNRLLGRTRAGEDGAWTVTARTSLKGASHTLRADQVGDRGKVLRRVEIPYDAAVEIVASGAVVVHPGNSLWRIARRLYGSGPAFTIIYQANKDRIRDPDRIYPGQEFTVPAR